MFNTTRVTDPAEVARLVEADSMRRLVGGIHIDQHSRWRGCRSHLKAWRTKDGRWRTRRGFVVAARITQLNHSTITTFEVV